MALQSKLEQRLVQKLVLTPTLQQAIRLLQMTRLELKEILNTELQVNPVLEDILSQDASKNEIRIEDLKTNEESDSEMETFFRDYWENGGVRQAQTGEVGEAAPIESISVETTNLVDYLLWQIQLMELPEELEDPVCFLIASLNEDGYLRDSLEQLADESDFDPELLHHSLRVVQSLDPTGIGARNHKECLLLQTHDPIVRKVIEDHWDQFLHQDYESIREATGLDERSMDAVHETVKHMDLYPGRKYSRTSTIYVEPDVYVIRRGLRYDILINDDGMPRLRINRNYMRIFREATLRKDEETSNYLRKKFRSAVWLLKSVEQRHRTLYKVTRSIVQFQNEYLDRGKEHLHPLTLKHVAEDISVHESTVSRVVSNKYVQTPRGVVPMKMFFLQGLPTFDGSSITVDKVKNLIMEIINQESRDHPLSDSKVAEIVQNRYHVRLARRTVAKYREEMGIPSSKERKL